MKRKRLVEIDIKLSEFEMPPMQDVLIIGRQAPIGSEAARRMVDALAPGQFETIPIDHPTIEAVAVVKTLFNLLPRETLLSVILEETGAIVSESMVTRAQVRISHQITRILELT